MKTRRSPSSGLQGRGLAIAVVVIIAGSSFALGFFVGKATVVEGPVEVLTITPDIPAPNALAVEESVEPSMPAYATEAVEEPLGGGPLTAAQEEPERTAHYGDPDGPVTYSVQVGAFSSLEDAGSLRDKLREKGYTVYIVRDAVVGNDILYKVNLGNFTDRERAKAVADRLKSTEGISAFVTLGK